MTSIACQGALITLAAENWAALVEFYGQVLGQSPAKLVPGIYAEFGLPGLRLGIFSPRSSDWAEFHLQAKSGLSVCLEVADLEAAIAHFTRLGYPPPGDIIIAAHGREIYAYDPAGNRLILHQAPS